jgi:hypothetical protein
MIFKIEVFVKRFFVLFGLFLAGFVFAQVTFDLQSVLPSWFDSNVFSQIGDTKVGTRNETRTENGANFNCTIDDMSLTAAPEKIVTFSPDSGVLYPTNLLQGRANTLGSLREVPVAAERRNPVQLSIDLPMENSTKRIEKPSLATVRSAINELRLEADRQGVRAPANYNYQSIIQYRADQASLQLGFDLRFLPVGLRAGAQTNSKKRTVTAFFVQKAFNINVDLGGNTPVRAFFPLDFREDEYKTLESLGAVGTRNAPTYVSTVTYGRMMLFSLESEASETELEAAIRAWSVGATGQYRQILQSSKLTVTTLGGTKEAAERAILYENPKAYFYDNAPLSSMVPISYELRTVKENSIAALKQTTQYSIERCQQIVTPPTSFRVDVILESVTAIRDCDPGILEGAGELFFAVYVGRTLLFEVPRVRSVQMDDGQTLSINKSLSFRATVGQSLVYSGNVYEGDDTVLGSSNTLIGEFTRNFVVTGNMQVDNRKESIRVGSGACQFEFNFRFQTSPL